MDSMEKFGKYVLVKLVATGGMAEVFLAKEFGISGFQRILAIKRVLPHLAKDREFIEQFAEEARLSAQLTHPNVVQVYEFGLIDGSYYIAMEYIDGMTLSDMLSVAIWRNEIPPIDLTLLAISELCQGLEYAHNKRSLNNEPLNLVHRDISPKNAMLSYDGSVKLMDFGIAKAADQQRQETVTGTIKGKISYLSPEQVIGQKLDRRSDVFSLGLVFYEMLTLQRCFTGDNEFSILFKIRMGEILKPSKLNPEISPELDAIVMKALHHDLEKRYQSAEELLNDINQFRYKSGKLASTTKLSAYLRGLKAPTEEDTLASLQRIDWSQVQADFGLNPTGSLRSEGDTLAIETSTPIATRTKTTTKSLKAPKDEGERPRKSQRSSGKDTSKSIRGSGEGKRAKRPARPVVEDEDLQSEEAEGPEQNKLVPLLLAVSVVVLVLCGGIVSYILWFRKETVVPRPKPTRVAQVTPATQPTQGTAIASAQPTLPPGGQPTAVISARTPAPGETALPLGTEIPGAPTAKAGPEVLVAAPTAAQGESPVPVSTAVAQAPEVEAPTNTPVKKATGTLVVQSSAPVELLNGGRSLGRLSAGGLKVTLPPGSYNLVAVGYIASPPTYYRSEFSVNVTAGQSTTHAVRFGEMGTLNITSAKPATLFVNNVKIDLTPIPRLAISAGTYELRFDFKSGESSRQRYIVRPGQFATVFGKL